MIKVGNSNYRKPAKTSIFDSLTLKRISRARIKEGTELFSSILNDPSAIDKDFIVHLKKFDDLNESIVIRSLVKQQDINEYFYESIRTFAGKTSLKNIMELSKSLNSHVMQEILSKYWLVTKKEIRPFGIKHLIDERIIRKGPQRKIFCVSSDFKGDIDKYLPAIGVSKSKKAAIILLFKQASLSIPEAILINIAANKMYFPQNEQDSEQDTTREKHIYLSGLAMQLLNYRHETHPQEKLMEEKTEKLPEEKNARQILKELREKGFEQGVVGGVIGSIQFEKVLNDIVNINKDHQVLYAIANNPYASRRTKIKIAKMDPGLLGSIEFCDYSLAAYESLVKERPLSENEMIDIAGSKSWKVLAKLLHSDPVTESSAFGERGDEVVKILELAELIKKTASGLEVLPQHNWDFDKFLDHFDAGFGAYKIRNRTETVTVFSDVEKKAIYDVFCKAFKRLPKEALKKIAGHPSLYDEEKTKNPRALLANEAFAILFKLYKLNIEDLRDLSSWSGDPTVKKIRNMIKAFRGQ